ncbi:MAG: membrane protein insertion efficiency factor YidD [Solirubrobacterales bacterium]
MIARGFRAAALAPVFVYRKLVSPLIASRCRYYPSCSSYAVEAVREYGVFRGFALAGWRLLRCNPFSDGGFDYVADQKLFRGRDHSADCDHKHKAVTVR